jgi:hypothetical protein
MEGIFDVYWMNNIMDKTYVNCNLDIVGIKDMSNIIYIYIYITDISDYIDYIEFVEDIDTDVK